MKLRRACTLIMLLAATTLAACGSSSSTASSSSTSTSPQTSTTQSTTATTSTQGLGPEGIPLEQGPLLAPASSTTPGTPVDGIKCAPVEQLVYHIHVHLQVYVNGQPRVLPAAIGLIGPVSEQTPYGPFYGAQTCYYWLHTHASDGVVHVESPSVRIYTLGNFFDEWRQPLSRTQVAGEQGKVTAYFNGKPWTQNPRAIPMIPHASIDLDVGSPVVPPKVISWAGTNL